MLLSQYCLQHESVVTLSIVGSGNTTVQSRLCELFYIKAQDNSRHAGVGKRGDQKGGSRWRWRDEGGGCALMRKRRNKVKTTAALFLLVSCRKGNRRAELRCSSTSTKVLFFFFSVVFLLFAKSRRFHEQDEMEGVLFSVHI